MDFPATIAVSGVSAWLVTLFLGLVFGSFASAIAYRMPRNIGWVSARSLCPACGHQLSSLDLVPVFSWLLLRGRCRHCRAAIGWRYPAIELTTLLVCLLVNTMLGLNGASLLVMMAIPFLAAMIAIDLEFMILPDHGNLILGVLGLGYVLATSGSVMGAIGSGLCYALLLFILGWVMARLLKRDAVGLGDVKFFAVAGIWLGVSMMPVFLVLSGVCGMVMGCFWKIYLKRDHFPFGPALIASLVLCVIFAAEIRGFLPFFF